MAIERETLQWMYRNMLTIRYFEERVVELFAAGKCFGFVHLYVGEEAVATGACANLHKEDYITSTHRGHGHLISKGGSMHIADVELGILGANGIVGGGFPIAVGAGFTAKYKGTNQVAACFFGDGASNQGTFHESLNMASIWKLPVIFINENNFYGISLSQRRSMNVPDVAARAAAYNIPGVVVDGNDVLAVYEAVQEAVKRARAGEGPTLIECKTYRHRGHFEGDPTVYRPEEEVQEWKKKDPIPRFEEKLAQMEIMTEEQMKQVREEIANKIEEAVKFAEESPWPSLEEVLEDVYA